MRNDVIQGQGALQTAHHSRAGHHRCGDAVVYRLQKSVDLGA